MLLVARCVQFSCWLGQIVIVMFSLCVEWEDKENLFEYVDHKTWVYRCVKCCTLRIV